MSTLTLADAKIYLGLTDTTHDGVLQDFIAEAESSIEAKCGPISSTAKTYRARGCKAKLALPGTPVLSLTSIVPLSTVGATLPALDVSTLNVSSAGVVENLNGAALSAPFYDIAYLAGRNPVPPDLLLAVKEHLRHLWASQRGSLRRPGADASPDPAAAYAFTWRVNELIAPHVQGGFA